MSISNCCFLTCIQGSQKASKVFWYSHLSKNFPLFVMINTVKGFSVINEAEVDVFLEFSCFFYDPVDVGNLISSSSAWTYGSSWFMYCWSLAWRILSITLLVCELSAIVWYFEHSLTLASFGIEMETNLLQSCAHCWVSQICCHIECSTFTASSFRIWNSSTGIPTSTSFVHSDAS